jgi:hypothetical protein
VSGVHGVKVSRRWLIYDLSALRKTGHLISALSSALPESKEGGTDATPPITYHPLDLSYPELHRVLGEMSEAFGDKLKDRVQCIGLHGDYDAGLQFIREGKLHTLRETMAHGQGLQSAFDQVSIAPSDESQGKSAVPSPIHMKGDSDPSPQLSAGSDALITPGPIDTALPSAVSDDSWSSEQDGTGTWSPIDDPVFPTPQRPLHLVFLGSSLGNFSRETAGPFLRSLPLRHGDTLLLGLDGRPAPGPDGVRKVEIAYNDPKGFTKAFEEHGWEVVRRELGLKGDAGVEFVGRYNELLGACMAAIALSWY